MPSFVERDILDRHVPVGLKDLEAPLLLFLERLLIGEELLLGFFLDRGIVSDDGILSDVDATIAHLQGHGFEPSKIGIVGFCFGGRVTFLVAARRALGAAVGFYGGGIAAAGGLPFPPLIDESPTLQTPWLGLFGDLDKGISVESVEALRTALGDAPVDAEIVRYPDADHGFHCDARASYHAESAADGWQRTLEWFARQLG